MNTIMNILVPYNAGNFVRGFATQGFSIEGLFHGVRGEIITMPRIVRCLSELTRLSFLANSHTPCRGRAESRPCNVALLPFFDSAVSFVKFRVVAGKIRTASRSSSLTDPFSFSVAIILDSMDSCEHLVIISCGLYLL